MVLDGLQTFTAHDCRSLMPIVALELENGSQPGVYRFTIIGGQRKALWDIWYENRPILLRNLSGVELRVLIATFPIKRDGYGLIRLDALGQ